MQKVLLGVILFAVVFGVSSALAGTFFSTLDGAHCRNLSPHGTRVGCTNYLNYRIGSGYDKREAGRTCLIACEKIIPNKPSQITECQAGCKKAQALDRSFFSTLESAHCKNLRGWHPVGCINYLNYRFESGYDKTETGRTCLLVCEKEFRNKPSQITGCQAGCKMAEALDRR